MSTEEWLQRMGVQIRDLRIEAGLSQTELAARADVGRSAVQAIEGGKSSQVEKFVRIVRALGRSEWLDQLHPRADDVNPLDLLAAKKQEQDRQRVARRNRKDRER